MRNHIALAITTGLILLTPATGNAWVWHGNPIMTITVDRKTDDIQAASGYVDKVRVHLCNGAGYVDYAVAQTADLAAGLDVPIQAGDVCGATVFWDSDVLIDHASWSATYSNYSTSVEITGDGEHTTSLMNLEILSGSFSGSAPGLAVNIN